MFDHLSANMRLQQRWISQVPNPGPKFESPIISFVLATFTETGGTGSHFSGIWQPSLRTSRCLSWTNERCKIYISVPTCSLAWPVWQRRCLPYKPATQMLTLKMDVNVRPDRDVIFPSHDYLGNLTRMFFTWMMTPTTLWTHSRINASSQRADVPRKPYLGEREWFIIIHSHN